MQGAGAGCGGEPRGGAAGAGASAKGAGGGGAGGSVARSREGGALSYRCLRAGRAQRCPARGLCSHFERRAHCFLLSTVAALNVLSVRCEWRLSQSWRKAEADLREEVDRLRRGGSSNGEPHLVRIACRGPREQHPSPRAASYIFTFECRSRSPVLSAPLRAPQPPGRKQDSGRAAPASASSRAAAGAPLPSPSSSASSQASLRLELEALRRRHDGALELLGERNERVEQLEEDIRDMQEIFRQQVRAWADRGPGRGARGRLGRCGVLTC